jgi:hypothetical protein
MLFDGTECSFACDKDLLVEVQKKRRIKKGKDGWCTIPAILIPAAAAVY